MKKLFKAFKKGQKGFTLIELLVVIAIIAVLAAIIVPNVGKYITSGQTAANAAELKMVKNAVAAAMADARVGALTTANSSWTATTPQVYLAAAPQGAGDLSVTGVDTIAHWMSDYFSDPTFDLAHLVQKYDVGTNGAVKVH